ncbi:MAG: C/D box methylation guide ribonucleoprotein complex aNOP56 subunit [Candidatus Lokiarchaeota archaeon]|nr:C/D box methylation guide ribonucleoprotein complex aNOP56 subunit [Candidatus Lokiarchaeota archaeon]
MKCFVIDSLIGIYTIDDSGNLLNFIDFSDDTQRVISFYESLDNNLMVKEYSDFINELRDSGFDEFVFDHKKLQTLTSKELGCNTFLESHSLEFKNFRFNLEDHLKRVGIHKNRKEILSIFKGVQEKLIKGNIKEAGGKEDLIIIQVIESLEILKKSISLFASRLKEWYGLHFPELTDKLIEDNVILAKMVDKLGHRDNYTLENINQYFNLTEKRTERLKVLAARSMGADIDLSIIKKYAQKIIELDAFREELEEYLEELMTQAAPNLTILIGSLIGAKLIAKAGSLKDLAYMPASRIQLLGAEKALYRFLKTGEKRPKHGLIFQWNLIRGSKAHIRGKISRVISGKLGIASKVDYFKGEFIGDNLASEIAEKIKDLEKKYSNPPIKKSEPKINTKKKQINKNRRRYN